MQLYGTSVPQSREPAEDKLGAFTGVSIPCLCTIFGVILFMRLGFIVGNAGLADALVIMAAVFVLASLTVSSMAALCSSGM